MLLQITKSLVHCNVRSGDCHLFLSVLSSFQSVLAWLADEFDVLKKIV